MNRTLLNTDICLNEKIIVNDIYFHEFSDNYKTDIVYDNDIYESVIDLINRTNISRIIALYIKFTSDKDLYKLLIKTSPYNIIITNSADIYLLFLRKFLINKYEC